MYAFYSKKEAQLGGTVTYARANGDYVICTCVGDCIIDYGRWDDIQCLGYVKEFIKRNDWGFLGPPIYF